jgi:hypothetical protein
MSLTFAATVSPGFCSSNDSMPRDPVVVTDFADLAYGGNYRIINHLRP